jgi:Flp pilus assembly protein TadG
MTAVLSGSRGGDTSRGRGAGGWLSAFAASRRGSAAVELSLIAGFLIVGLFNAIDLARYAYQGMEVHDAAQMGAQSVWQTCDTSHLPATTACTNMSTQLTAAIQSTSLGANVSQVTGSPAEAYYCVNNLGALVWVSNISTKPSDCSSVSNPTGQPGDYIQIQVTYAFSPLFPLFNASSALPRTITSTALMRLK